MIKKKSIEEILSDHKVPTGEELIYQIQFMAEEVHKILFKRDYHIEAYNHESLLSLKKDPLEKKLTAFHSMKSYLNIIRIDTVLYNTGPLNDIEKVSVLHSFFKVYGALAKSEIYDEIKKGNIIEVYTDNHRQVHRNLEFFDECKYDYLTLSKDPWFELYERDKEIEKELIYKADQFFKTGKTYDAMTPHIPEHRVKEIRPKVFSRGYSIKMERWVKISNTSGDLFLVCISKTKPL